MAKTLSSQRLEWLLVCATVGLCALIVLFARGDEPQVGHSRTITVSVVPADKRGLGCAHQEAIAGMSCAYASAERKAPRRKIDEQERLAPYVTTKGELVVLAGVFAGESVAQTARQKSTGRKNRFSIRCQVKILAHVAQIPIRFSEREEFKPAERVWIGKASDCESIP